MKMTTNEVVVQGVILKETSYKDHDVILNVYTKDYGKISILAKGVKKLTSKNARACQSMMVSEMTICLRKGLSRLVRATPIDYFRHVHEQLECEIVGNYILEYFYRYIEENDPIEEEYDVLYAALHALDLGYSPLLVYLMFNVFILEENGIHIDVDGCVKCGSSQVVSISLEDGGFLCADHLGHHHIYDVDVLKAFRHIHKIPFAHIDKIHMEEDVYKQLIPIIDYYIDEYCGIVMKTSKFIQQIV